MALALFIPSTLQAQINFADYLPLADGYTWKGVSLSCSNPCSCTPVDVFDVDGPAPVAPDCFRLALAGTSYAAVLGNNAGNFTYHGFYDGPTYVPAIGGPHSLTNIPDGYFFQTDAVEQILVRDWNLITHPDKALYGIPPGLNNLVVLAYYDLNPTYPTGPHDAVFESGLPAGTSLPQGTITALDWFEKDVGFLYSMDVDAQFGTPSPPVLDTVWTASLDCNGNGIFDRVDIANNTSLDTNSNCIPDECESPGNAFCFGDGTGIPCPCLVNGNTGQGCMNSGGAGGAMLSGTGNASLAMDSFQLNVSGVPGNKPGLIIQGTIQTISPVGEGLFCVNGATARSHVQVTSSGSTTFLDFQGSPFGASINALGVPMLYQFWYRDPSNTCAGAGFNFSNAWKIVWLP